MITIEFDWYESSDKRKHFYVFGGYCSDRLGFVTYQYKGWKGKSYMPGARTMWFGSREQAQEYVEESIRATLHSIQGLPHDHS